MRCLPVWKTPNAYASRPGLQRYKERKQCRRKSEEDRGPSAAGPRVGGAGRGDVLGAFAVVVDYDAADSGGGGGVFRWVC